MNLYDNDDGFKKFTLAEANALLPEVISATKAAVLDIKVLEERLKKEQVLDAERARTRLEDESSKVLQNWAQRMVELGVYPKGYFTVDFKSPIPDTLFCWTYGEKRITHTHKIHESFKDRIPIESQKKIGFEQSLN